MSNNLLAAELAELNEKQRQAVEAKQRQVLVAASAGTGKTTVLASRVLNNLDLGAAEDKINVKDFLILTFTEEAAKNMKDRIRTKLQKLLLVKDVSPAQKTAINAQINQLDDADISTIDAFCHKIVQTYFYKLGIDPEYDILAADSAKAKFRAQALDESLEEAYQKAQADAELHDFLVFLTGDREDNTLRNVLTSLFDFLGSIDDPKTWLEAQVTDSEDFKYKYIKELFERKQALVDEVIDFKNAPVGILANEYLSGFIKKVTGIHDMLQNSENIADFKQKYDEEYKDDTDKVKMTSAKSISLKVSHKKYIKDKKSDELEDEFLRRYIVEVQAYQEAAKELNETRAPKKPKPAVLTDNSETVYYLEEAKLLLEGQEIKTREIGTQEISVYGLDVLFHNEYKKIEEFVKLFNKIIDAEKNIEANLDTFIKYKTNIIELYKNFAEKYQAIKAKNNLYEYADIERMAYELLENQDVKVQLQAKYHQIIVDEYQDTNRLQDTIITEIAGQQNKLFLVGDVKQAIYGFRNADHTVFIDKQAHFSQADDGVVLTLEENYRTRKEITDKVNDLFEHIMAAEDEVSYQGQAIQAANPMYQGIEADENIIAPFEFNIVEYGEGEDKTEVQAKQVIAAVQAMLNDQQGKIRQGSDQVRALEPKDIAIISRSWSGSGLYTKLLKDAGIAYRISRSEEFLEKYEIRVALAYLKMLVDPFDNISTVAVLHSPIYGFDEKELAFMKVVGKGKKFATKYWSLLSDDNVAETMQKADEYQVDFEALKAKLTQFQNDYSYLSQLADVLSASALLNKIYENTDIIESFTAMPRGNDRRANLYGLISYLEELENTVSASVQEVIAIFENSEKVEEINQNADDNAVTYTTIHGSKGLEWPVVFVVNTENQYRPDNGKVIYARNPKLGIGMKTSDNDKKAFFRKPVANENYQRNVNEQKRFMYVALTRAQQALRIYGAVKTDKEAKEKIDSNLALLKAAAKKAKLEVNEKDVKESISSVQMNETSIPTPKVKESVLQAYQFNAASEIKTSSPTTAVKKSFNPFGQATEIGSTINIDVTQDTNLLDDDDFEVSADEFGTAVHLIFEKLALNQGPTKESVQDLVRTLNQQGIIASNVMQALNKPVSSNGDKTHLDGIVGFYQTEIGQEVLKAAQAGKLEREKNITMMVSAETVANDENAVFEDDFTVIHGIIDCLYQKEDGSFVIVDYKTDKHLDNEKVFKENYPGQLAMYAKTLEMMGKKVAACYLYGVRHQLVFDVMKK